MRSGRHSLRAGAHRDRRSDHGRRGRRADRNARRLCRDAWTRRRKRGERRRPSSARSAADDSDHRLRCRRRAQAGLASAHRSGSDDGGRDQGIAAVRATGRRPRDGRRRARAQRPARTRAHRSRSDHRRRARRCRQRPPAIGRPRPTPAVDPFRSPTRHRRRRRHHLARFVASHTFRRCDATLTGNGSHPGPHHLQGARRGRRPRAERGRGGKWRHHRIATARRRRPHHRDRLRPCGTDPRTVELPGSAGAVGRVGHR